MVHAFCGVIITYMDADWVLREYVLDLIPLAGDHSGKSVGKLMFRRLKKENSPVVSVGIFLIRFNF
jgi:hypothetical protein